MQEGHPSVVWLGKFLRERRETKGWKLQELAERTSRSASSLEKVERGKLSPGLDYLSELFDELDIIRSYRETLINGLFPGLLGRLYGPSNLPPTDKELAYLRSISVPAAYVYFPSGDVAATNEHWDRRLLRLNGGSNLFEWGFTDPAARVLLPDWERLAHMLVYALKWLGPSALPAARIEQIRANCSTNPEFNKMWTTPLPNPSEAFTNLRVIYTLAPSIMNYDINFLEPSSQDRRWLVFTLVPFDPDE
ncbi:helix-turn-helix domain-containing protein [Nocardia sp. NPDC051570]|uniref:helix-turn-helix domain-containing protein n=1 Tax=Nocardia sp. NPDC051570 TaxID=3364324 RepID=UPI0037938761